MTDEAPPAAGIPIDGCELPEWGRAYLYESQRDLDRGLQWMLLFYAQKGLHPSRAAVAQRLYISTLGKRAKYSLMGQRGLASDLDLSLQTVNVSLADLVELGWVVFEVVAGKHRTRLAWPVRDCIAVAPAEGPALCGQPAKKGLCGRRAGHGTTHRGEGPCYRHGGERASEDLESPPVPQAQVFQPLEHPAADETPPSEPPRLVVSQRSGRPGPVDKGPYQPPLLTQVFQPLEPGVPTIGAQVFQPLEPGVPTVGTEYVTSSLPEFVISQSAADKEAHRWLNARYGLTDQESAEVVREARRRAASPIKYPVPYLNGMAEGDLADIVAAVMDARDAHSAPPPTISAVGQWCGHCDQHTRLTGDPDRPRRCPECHPLRSQQAS